MNKLKIRNGSCDRYELILCSLGYESRSSAAAMLFSEKCERRCCVVLPKRDGGCFDVNRSLFVRERFDFIEPGEISSFISKIDAVFSQLVTNEVIRVAIDISCMPRSLIAHIVSALFSYDAGSKGLDVDFIYMPAVYESPKLVDGPILISEPVTEDYAGGPVGPDQPPVAIVGLGYECDRALGGVEFLEPRDVWLFIPNGFDERYRLDVIGVNHQLISEVPAERVLSYEVAKPSSLFIALESLVYGLEDSFRVITLPFGPKIFSLVSMMVSRLHADRNIVWRISGDDHEAMFDRVHDGNLVVFPISLSG